MQTAAQWMWPWPAQVICNKFLPDYCGSLSHVVLLIEEYLIDHLDTKILQEACERCAPPHILEFILMRTAPAWPAVVHSASKGGYVHVFQWMTEREDGRGPWGPDLKTCFEEAAAHGHLELLKWLHMQRLPVCHRTALHRAAVNGYLSVVIWLYHHTNMNYAYLHDTMMYAVSSGHFEVVRWMHENLRPTNLARVLVAAARTGPLHVVRWLHQRVSCPETCTTALMDAAIDGDQLDVVDWLVDHCSAGCSKDAAYNAASNGNIQMLQWLWNHRGIEFDENVMDAAAVHGHLEAVKCTSIVANARLLRWMEPPHMVTCKSFNGYMPTEAKVVRNVQ
ncbi:unnamed protein product [Phytophthora fragariaefolia]|uniref:Unnamed protein product n=1 Tax=Phytophthora fragariaefolia TaxID=1490495 RepID=A0A9W6YCE3_9STRA|nr:unnamed protein product [Phytophthora fragariaefolia]